MATSNNAVSWSQSNRYGLCGHSWSLFYTGEYRAGHMPWQLDCHTPLPHTQPSAAGRAASVQPCLRPLKNVSLLCPEVMPSWRLGCCLPPMLLSEHGVQVSFACPFPTPCAFRLHSPVLTSDTHDQTSPDTQGPGPLLTVRSTAGLEENGIPWLLPSQGHTDSDRAEPRLPVSKSPVFSGTK